MVARLRVILVVSWALAAPVRATSHASTNPVGPLDYTRSMLQQASAIVGGNQTHDQKVAALSVLFAKFLDTDAMARDALGQHWSSFTLAQQKEFLPLFRELIEKAFYG